MDQFVERCRTNLERVNQLEEFVCVVLGNEACDLDSAASALAYARFLETSVKHCGVNIPVINVARKDFPLKTEVVHFFRELKIRSECLVFRDDIDLISLHSKGILKLVLVDHNILPLIDEDLDSCVVEVIDHHKLERSTGTAEITVEPVGSCSTLVSAAILAKAPDLLDSTLATLLLGTIILDTANFSTTAKRATAKDSEMADKLRQLVPHVSPDKLFVELQQAKADVSGLSTEQLLRKDVKVVYSDVGQVAVCSLPILSLKLLDQFKTREDAIICFELICSENAYSALVLVGIAIDDETSEIKRDLTVFSISNAINEFLCQGLEDHDQPNLNLALTTRSRHVKGQLTHYHQENVTASRKVILPALRGLLTSQSLSSFPALTSRTSGPEIQVVNAAAAPHADPIVLEDGSHHSSTVDSGPYTPSNSCADDGEAPISGQSVPSVISSSILAERLSNSKGMLQSGTCRSLPDADPNEEVAYPFTPKNSFVDGGFEQAYQRFVLNHVDTEAAIMEKLSREKFFQGFEGEDNDS